MIMTSQPAPRPDDSTINMLEFVSVLCNPNHHRSNGDLDRLSIPERTRVFEDLVGSTPLPAEEVNHMVKSIQEMEVELSKISKKDAFDKVLASNPEYVNDIRFRLMFLRASDYDPRRSAEQLVNHFEEKLSLFGEDKLGKDIKLSDLSEDDYDSLLSGGIQVANTKDQAGRVIMYFRFAEYKYKTHDNWVSLGFAATRGKILDGWCLFRYIMPSNTVSFC